MPNVQKTTLRPLGGVVYEILKGTRTFTMTTLDTSGYNFKTYTSTFNYVYNRTLKTLSYSGTINSTPGEKIAGFVLTSEVGTGTIQPMINSSSAYSFSWNSSLTRWADSLATAGVNATNTIVVGEHPVVSFI